MISIEQPSYILPTTTPTVDPSVDPSVDPTVAISRHNIDDPDITMKSFESYPQFQIAQYKKHQITSNNLFTTGTIRSVVVSNDEFLSFSPPKSIPYDQFMSGTHTTDSNYYEEIVEGIMINCFCNDGVWYAATKSKILGTIDIDEHIKSGSANPSATDFKTMFLDTLLCSQVNVKQLREDWSYSFIIQHPSHTIVNSYTTPTLTLIRVYNLDTSNNQIIEHSGREKCVQNEFSRTKISFPKLYVIPNNDYTSHYQKNSSVGYITPGIMISNTRGIRTKIRNPLYEMVRHAKSNINGRNGKEFSRSLLNKTPNQPIVSAGRRYITIGLYNAYVLKYIRKNSDNTSTTVQHKSIQYHLRILQNIYLSDLKPNQLKMSEETISQYIRTISLPEISKLYHFI